MSVNLTTIGTPTYPAGKFTTALAVSAGNYLKNSGGASAVKMPGSFTIEWWSKFSGGGYQFVFASGNEWFGFVNGKLSSNANGGGNMSSTSYNDNAWHHIAFTFSGSTEYIYVDGAQVYTGSNTFTSNNFGADVYIGTQDGTNNNYTGMIDELRLSSSVRYTSAFTPSPSPFSTDPFTLALWHFNGNGTDEVPVTPLDITGIVQRFRASTLTGITNGASVSSAAFEIGGITLSQPTVVNQPKYNAAGINGNASLTFDGASSFMTGSASSTTSQPFTLAFIMRFNKVQENTQNAQEILYSSSLELIINSTYANTYETSANGTALTGGYPKSGAHVIMITSASAGAMTTYVDGALISTGNVGGSNIGNYRLGSHNAGSRWLNGEISEIVAYSKVLSVSEQAKLDTYAQNTYGITMSDYAASTSSASRFVRSNDLTNIVLANVKAPAGNTQTTSYTLKLNDTGKIVEMNVSALNTVTIPSNSSVAFPIGALITVYQTGIGQTNVVAGTGVTVDAPWGTAIYARYSVIQLRQRAINEWVITGAATSFYDPTAVSGLVYRMRASMLGITTNGTSITSITPEIGSTVLSQGTVSSQPVWYAAGKNGKPYIAFDGVDDYLFNSSGPTLNQPVTIAMAVQVYDSNGPKELIKMGGIELIVNSATNGGGRWALYSGSSVDNVFQPGGVSAFIAYFGMGGAGNGRGYTNGTLTSSSSIGNNSTNGDFYIGTHTSIARYSWMDLYEILIYNSSLSATDIQNVNAYLRAYYQ